MKAAIFKGKGIVEIEETATPQFADTDVLIMVQACGVCGTDVHIFHGSEGAAAVTPPVILGHEFSGIVEKTGSKVEGIRIGDRVSVDPNNTCGSCYYCSRGMAHFCEHMIGYGTTFNGGFAQYCAVHYKQLYRLADTVTFEEGSLCEPVSCCLHGIDNCGIRPGGTVMVIGGGTIGLIMIQLAKLNGAAEVILLEPIAEKREIGKKVGADIVIDPIHEDVVSIMRGMRPVETVIECVGLKSTMLDALKFAGKNSIVMFFGLGNPNDEISIKPFEIFKKEIQIKASYINPYTQGRAMNLINSGRLDLKTLIAGTVPLNELSVTLSDPNRRRNGKIIVNPWANE